MDFLKELVNPAKDKVEVEASEVDSFITAEGIEVDVDLDYFDDPANQTIPRSTKNVGDANEEVYTCVCQDPDALPTEGIEVVCPRCGGVYYEAN